MPSRLLLFTGKGGVGKTTTAAATALLCAEAGARVLVLSTDPAHSLADALDVELGPLVAPVTDGLWGQQLDAQERMEEAWSEIQDYLREVLAWAGADAVEAEELSVVPGLDEVFALADIKQHAEDDAWDVIVVDCAPTAETLRLLSLPDVLSWYMERVFPIGRRVNRLVAPVLSRVTSLPVAHDNVFAATRRFYDRLDGVRELLTDPARTSVRLVVNPERMVIAEARRTYTYLSLFGYRVDAVIANRLLPDEVVDPWFKAWKEAHVEHLSTIESGFAPLPILRAELAPQELVGIEPLRQFGGSLYGDLDPASIMHAGEAFRIVADGPSMVLHLPLPGAAKQDVEVGESGGELFVKVGPYRRALVLPDSLRRRSVDSAKLDDGVLTVTFGPKAGRT